jgi:hypothetical protein
MHRVIGLLVLTACGCHFNVAGLGADTRSDGGASGRDDLGAPVDLAAAAVDLAPPPSPDLAPEPVVPVLVVDVRTPPTDTVDLTREGTRDWMHAGRYLATARNHKKGGTEALAVTASKTILQWYAMPLTFAWSDGDPTGTEGGTDDGVWIDNGGAFTVTARAGTALRTMRLYVGGSDSRGKLRVTVPGLPTVEDTSTGGDDGNWAAVFEIKYRAASDGQTLTVTWERAADTGANHMHLQAISVF